MFRLILIIAALVLAGVGAWFNSARIVGIGTLLLAVVALWPYVD
jgi:hypothetical protein